MKPWERDWSGQAQAQPQQGGKPWERDWSTGGHVADGPATSQAESFGRGAVQGASFGFADEAMGAMAGAASNPYTKWLAPMAGMPTPLAAPIQMAAQWIDPDAYDKAATATTQANRDANAGAREANPWTYFGGEVAGGAPLAVATGGGGAAVNTLRGAAYQGAKTGAVTGAAYGAGAAEGGIPERAWGAASGAAIGTVAGAALPAVIAPFAATARAVARPFMGRSGAYQKLASQMELDGDLATMGDNIAAGAQTAAHPIERRALDVLGDEMLRTRNAAAARQATADRLATEFRITSAEAADHIAELEARQAASPLFFGEHPNIGPRDSMAAALQRGSHPTPRDHAAERFLRTPDETVSSTVVDYLANNGGQAARRVRSGVAMRNAALPHEVEGALQRMQPPHMRSLAGSDPNAEVVGYRLATARSGPRQDQHLGQFHSMSPEEQSMAQIGWIRAKIGRLNDLPDGADPSKILTNETTRIVAEQMFGRHAVVELQRALASVQVAKGTARRIGGSQTYPRGEMKRVMDGEINAVAAADSLSVGVVRKWLADMAAIAMRGRRNEYMADVVMTPMRDMPQVASHLAQLRRTQATAATRAAAAAAGRTGTARIGIAARALGASAPPAFNALASNGDRR